MIAVNDKIIQYYEGMSIADAIKEAGEMIDQMTIIMQDKSIIQYNQIDKKVSDGTNLRILRILSGG